MNLTVISKKVLTASLVFAATASLAFANVGHHKGYKGENYKGEAMAEPCPPPAMLMGGFYLGAQLGYDTYLVGDSFNVATEGISISGNPKAGIDGWLGGLYLGYGQYFNAWYLGAEIFGNWDSANKRVTVSAAGDGTVSNKFEANANYGISLIPGVRVNDTTLAYLRLGWNWANLKDSWYATNAAGATVSGSKSNTSNGFQYGIGLETLLVANWSVRGEVNHTSFGSFSTGPFKVKPADTQALVGVTYHFA